MADQGIKVSRNSFDVEQASGKELLLDTTYPTHKIDIVAEPTHFALFEFEFVTDLPVVEFGNEDESWTYTYNFTEKEYIPAVWVYIDEITSLENDTYGHVPYYVAVDGSGSNYQIKYSVTNNSVEIEFSKHADAPLYTNHDFSGQIFQIRIYIFEEESS